MNVNAADLFCLVYAWKDQRRGTVIPSPWLLITIIYFFKKKSFVAHPQGTLQI